NSHDDAPERAGTRTRGPFLVSLLESGRLGVERKASLVPSCPPGCGIGRETVGQAVGPAVQVRPGEAVGEERFTFPREPAPGARNQARKTSRCRERWGIRAGDAPNGRSLYRGICVVNRVVQPVEQVGGKSPTALLPVTIRRCPLSLLSWMLGPTGCR